MGHPSITFLSYNDANGHIWPLKIYILLYILWTTLCIPIKKMCLVKKWKHALVIMLISQKMAVKLLLICLHPSFPFGRINWLCYGLFYEINNWVDILQHLCHIPSYTSPGKITGTYNSPTAVWKHTLEGGLVRDSGNCDPSLHGQH